MGSTFPKGKGWFEGLSYCESIYHCRRFIHLFNRNVLHSHMKSLQHFCMHNISAVHWLSKDTVKFTINGGVCEKFAKM